MRFAGVLAGGAVLAVAGLAAYGWGLGGGDDAAPRYRTVLAQRGAITSAVSATGSIAAVLTVDVSSQVSGQIKEILADFNTPVTANQEIAVIDPEVFETKVRQAAAELEMARAAILNQEAAVLRTRADVESAQANLAAVRANVARAEETRADAERELARKLPLGQTGVVSQRDIDKARTDRETAVAALRGAAAQEQGQLAAIAAVGAQLKGAEAALASAKAQAMQREAALAQAQAELAHTRIRAPLDGVVILRNVNLGQTVAASLSAPVLFTIAQDLAQMQVELSIDEADVGRVREGLNVTFTVDAFPGRNFRGRVRQVRKAPRTVQNVVSYVVVVATDNPDLILLPGMTANARIIVEQRANALLVPNAAFRYRPGPVQAPAQAPASDDDEPDEAPQRTAGRGGPAGGPGQAVSPEVQARRLTQALQLQPAQTSAIETIFAEAAERIVRLRRQAAPQAEIANAVQDNRRRVTERIMATLNPEQQTRYREIISAQSGRSTVRTERVFVVGEDGQPKVLQLRVGLSDGNVSEVLGGELAEGQAVIVGNAARAAATGSAGRPALFGVRL